MLNHYVYIYLNPLKPGVFNYGRFEFNYEPFYIGKGFNNRINWHLKEAKYLIENDIIPTGNRHKLNTIIKIVNNGFEPIRIKIYENISNFSACRCERNLIRIIGRNDLKKGPLTNMTDGGEGSIGFKMSEESKKKMSESIKKIWKENYEYYCSFNIGEKNGFYNKKHSEKSKKIFSEIAKRTFTGKKQSNTQIKNRADAIRGDKNGMYGTSVYKKWIEKYGKELADKKYEKWLNENRKGINNPMYGKKDGNHPSNKKIILVFPNGAEMQFNGHKQCKLYLEKQYIVKKGFSYNSLRQYSNRNKKYQEYFIRVE
jgi:hypothetical protein